MPLSTQPYKGSRDFYPDDFRVQQWMFDVAQNVLKSFGYERYDGPMLEPLELYAAKTGDEIVNEQTYTFEDRGGRQVVIRPEMTPTVSRMVAAKRQELAYPLRWYSIPNLWRYERPQRGRLREHWQLNVDLFGVTGLEAEHEMLLIIDGLLQAFKAKRHMYIIKLGSRKLMNFIMKDYLGLDNSQSQVLAKLIDRMNKITQAQLTAAIEDVLKSSKRKADTKQKLQEILKVEQLSDLPTEIYEHQAADEVKRLLAMAQDSGLKNVVFDITIMRGFDYYTDIVFEVFDNDPVNSRSIFGGGRYDGMVGLFGVDDLPTIGFGVGDVGLKNFLETHKLLPHVSSDTDAYVILIGGLYQHAQKVLADLRDKGLNIAVDTTARKPTSQLKSAIKKGIPIAIFIGEKELKCGRFTVKSLANKDEQQMNLEQTAAYIKQIRQARKK